MGTASTVWLFPGQGSQYPGMGRAVAGAYPEARKVFRMASKTLGMDMEALCFEGSEDDLRLTANAQPAILTVSLAAATVVRRVAPAPAYMAGHSLGEYAALICAGGLPPEEGLRLIRRRGELMGGAFPSGDGAMAAVIGLDAAEVEAACREAGGTARVANYNSPGQTVVSGLAGDVERAGGIASRMGAKRVIPLAVSGPFHTRLMEPPAAAFAELLDAAPLRDLDVPVVFNVDATPRRRAEDVRAALKRQMASGVRWEETMLRLRQAGVTAAVEVGPRNVLAGLMKRTVPEITTRATDQPADIEALRDAFAKGA